MTGFDSKRQAAQDKVAQPEQEPVAWGRQPFTNQEQGDVMEESWRCSHGWLRGEQCEICTGCEGKPSDTNNPCAVCGKAQPEQEPVAWGFRHHDGAIYDCISPEAHADCEGEYNVPLYDAPPKRKPLTNEQIVVILKDPNIAEKHQRNWLVLPYAYARAIEDAHGIKE